MTAVSLSDRVVARLSESIDAPALTGTRYTMERAIGRGGLGTVYAVFDQVLQRRVALKVLTAVDDPDRLLSEARTVAQLEHPGIVPVHDAGRLGDGRAYYTMKLVDGVHLDECAKATSTLSDRLRVFQKLCDAVAYAHSRGVVHRDLKPSNVMVGTFGEVFVMDWGIGVAGTARYRAPEQAEQPSGDAAATVDVHALGVILRGLLPPRAPKPLEAVANRAAAADPAARYADAALLNREIARYLDEGTVDAYRESRLERAVRFYRSNQPLLVLLLVYVLVRFALFLWR